MSAETGPNVLAYCTCGHFLYDHLVRTHFPQGACSKCSCGGATMGGQVWPYKVPNNGSN